VELHFHARQTARDKREWKFRTDFVDVAVTVRNPRKVRISSGDSRNAVTKLNKGMERLPSPISGPLRRRTQYPPAPKCSAAELWKTAIEHGAPPALPAVIEYDRSGYRFRNGAIPTDFTLAFGHDCKPVEG
jgi:hypothetical protein